MFESKDTRKIKTRMRLGRLKEGFLGGLDGKESACNARDLGSVPGLGRSPGGGQGQPTVVFLPGESPWTEEPGGLQFTGSQRVEHN